jgi:hypothetical protein
MRVKEEETMKQGHGLHGFIEMGSTTLIAFTYVGIVFLNP